MTTKEKLITTTATLIRKKGYFGTGINEVLKLVNLPKGSLYHHFPQGKDHLVIEAVRFAGTEQLSKYEAALKGRGANEGLKAVVDVLIRDLDTSGFSKGCPMATVILEVSGENEAIRKACEQMFVDWQKGLAGYLERRGISNALAKSKQFFAMIEGGYVLSKAHKNTSYLAMQKHYVDSLLDT